MRAFDLVFAVLCTKAAECALSGRTVELRFGSNRLNVQQRIFEFYSHNTVCRITASMETQSDPSATFDASCMASSSIRRGVAGCGCVLRCAVRVCSYPPSSVGMSLPAGRPWCVTQSDVSRSIDVQPERGAAAN